MVRVRWQFETTHDWGSQATLKVEHYSTWKGAIQIYDCNYILPESDKVVDFGH